MTRVCIIVLLFTAGDASAALFGVQSLARQIVEIDPKTGSVLRSMPTPDQSVAGGVALSGAEHGSKLLYLNIIGETTLARLTEIDPVTGAVLRYHDANIGGEGLSAQTSGGVTHLIHVSQGVATGQVGYDGSGGYSDFKFNYARGAAGGDDFGRAFVAAWENFAPFDTTIYEVDPFFQTLAPLNQFSAPARVVGLAFDGAHLYASAGGLLYTLDPDSGEIQNSVTVAGGTVTGLAVAVPEPGLVCGVGATVATLGAFLRRPRSSGYKGRRGPRDVIARKARNLGKEHDSTLEIPRFRSE